MAENSDGILYLEGTTDFDLLKAWAGVLAHPLKEWFASMPFWHNNQGRDPKEAQHLRTQGDSPRPQGGAFAGWRQPDSPRP